MDMRRPGFEPGLEAICSFSPPMRGSLTPDCGLRIGKPL